MRNKTTTGDNLVKKPFEDRKGTIRLEQDTQRNRLQTILFNVIFKPFVQYILLGCSIASFVACTWQSTVVRPDPEDEDSPSDLTFDELWYILQGCLNLVMFIEPVLRLITIGRILM